MCDAGVFARQSHRRGRGTFIGAVIGGFCAVFIGVMGAGCSEMDNVDGFSNEDWKNIHGIEPLSTPIPDNPVNHRVGSFVANLPGKDDALARFGQELFFETAMAEAIKVAGPSGMVGETGKVGCVTCHDTKYFTDSRPILISHGADRYEGHNTPSIVNAAWWTRFLTIGIFDSLKMHGCYGTGQEATPLAYAHYLFNTHREEYNALFPDAPLDPALDATAPDAARFPATNRPPAGSMVSPYAGMTDADKNIVDTIQANVGRAFEAYPRRLSTTKSPFKDYVNGDHTAINDSAKRGLRLFIGKAACNDCHYGPLLSDNKFHNIGIQTPEFKMPDQGRAGILPLVLNVPDTGPGSFNHFNGVGPYSDDPVAGAAVLASEDAEDCLPHAAGTPCMPKPEVVGAFRTPSLIDIAETGPYFHTGEAATLEDVLHHYNMGGAPAGSYAGDKSPRLVPLGLTDAEIADIIAFLHTLTAPFDDPSFACDPHKDGCLPPPS